MAKKKNAKKKKKINSTNISSKTLPQNIVQLGERVEEDKNIYIYQKTYKEIQRFTKNKVKNESGGILVGSVKEELGKTNILITGFIEAKHCEGTPTTLTFTHETWEYVHKEMNKKFPKDKIVGWIHTHPDFGIFLSEYDKFIHENFFNEENQVAYVIDPIQKEEGFYFWINGKLEKCKGFYVYDQVGVKIELAKNEKIVLEPASENTSRFVVRDVLLGVLIVLLIFSFISNSIQTNRIKRLERKIEKLDEEKADIDDVNEILVQMQAVINDLYQKVESLNASEVDNSTEETEGENASE